jgi:enoyl-CoA hydratase/carnithine racemase
MIVLFLIRQTACTIRFDNAEKLNALTFQTYVDLERIMEDLARDDAVDVVMITGTGKGFCSGGMPRRLS